MLRLKILLCMKNTNHEFKNLRMPYFSGEPPGGAMVTPTAYVITPHPLSVSLPPPRRYKAYRPVRRPLLENACCHAGVAGRVLNLRSAFFPSNEESHHLLTERRPL